MAGVTPGMIVGVTTEVIAGEGLILTAGGIDTHIHFICPQQVVRSARRRAHHDDRRRHRAGDRHLRHDLHARRVSHLQLMLQADGRSAAELRFHRQGQHRRCPTGLPEQIRAGAIGLKLHEDWGTTPAAIDCCLRVADEHDVQVTIHTDTLNESGFVEDTIAAFKGRTIHTYHTEGAGGGHAPDIIRVCGEPNVLPSSTNPTRPYTVNTLDEHLDMLMVCHHLDPNLPEDVAFAESRIRGETIAAEDILHDLGAISMMIERQPGDGPHRRSHHAHLADRGQDEAAARPLARRSRATTTTSASSATSRNTRSIRRSRTAWRTSIGSIEVGKLADLVLWKPAFFGVKPEMVIKGGVIAWAQMGDPNASIPTPQPVFMRPMFGAFGRATGATALAFVCRLSLDAGRREPVRSDEAHRWPCAAAATLGKRDMKLNDALPKITVDPETYEVTRRRRSCSRASRRRCCRWRSGTSCFDGHRRFGIDGHA